MDKDNNLRTGVVCSYGNKMGNYAAGVLMYKLSRKYSATLYINAGVAGRLADINVGDVVFVDSLFSAGENNANNTTYQLQSASNYNRIELRGKNISQAVSFFLDNKYGFPKYCDELNQKFRDKLKLSLEQTKGFTKDSCITGISRENKCKLGTCISFPEVIKDTKEITFRQFMQEKRLKNAVVDMEAFYFSEWYNIISRNEPGRINKKSEFISIKSVSDCGDDYKKQYEAAGSRELAMTNIAEVITSLCCEAYNFPYRENNGTLLDFLRKTVSEKSVVRTVSELFSTEKDKSNLIESFSSMIKHFVYSETNDKEEGIEDCSCEELGRQLSGSNSVISIYGRTGTGKTTFLSYLYQYLTLNNIPVVYWEIPFFLEKRMITPRQIIYFLSRLFKKDNSIVFIVDGTKSLDGQKEAYEEFGNFLKNAKINQLCISYGDVINNGDNFKNIVDTRFKYNNSIHFRGVCIASDGFDSMLNDALKYFNFVHNHKLSSDILKRFLLSSDGSPKIISVDYLLLFMISEQSQLLFEKGYKYFYTFISAYLRSKYNTKDLENYYSEVKNSFTDPAKLIVKEYDFDTYKMYKYNIYAEYIAYVTVLYDLFKDSKNNKEKWQVLLSKQIVFPSDMTMILEDKLIEAKKRPQNATSIYNSIKDLIKNFQNKSIEMEMQIFYTACNLCRGNENMLRALRLMINNRLSSITQSISISGNADIMLEYRTLCIILSIIYNQHEELNNYNKMILEDAVKANANLAFHLYYYSRRVFSLTDVISLDIENAYEEMVYNTYYVLESEIKSGIESKLTIPFSIHNIITYIQLYNIILSNDKKYDAIAQRAKTEITNIKKIYSSISPRVHSIDYFLNWLDDINI